KGTSSSPRYTHRHNHGSPVGRAERKRSTLRPSNLIWVMPAQGGAIMGVSTSSSLSPTATSAPAGRTLRWRVVAVVVAGVVGVAAGLMFLLWNIAYGGPGALLEPLLPGLQ